MSKTELLNRNEKRLTYSVLIAVVCLAVLTASGCMVGPNYQPQHPAVPTEWVGVSKTPTGQPAVATAQPTDLIQWWRQFNDPILTSLTEEALNKNLDLQTAEARLRQARAMRGVTVGGLWPAVTASGSYQLLHKASNSSNENLYQYGFDSVWELDLFGGLHRAVESADANVQAAIEGIRDAQVSLIAEVALNYAQLRGYQQEIVIAQNNVKAQQHTADITHKLFSVGFASALDVANADSNVATTESQIPVFEIQAQQSIYALSVLLARLPADLLKQLSPTGSLPTVPTEIPVGLPSDLLRRRPDIREAEAQLHAATAQIGVAVADFFPTFSLTGSMNWNTDVMHNASHYFALGPSVTWPIFQGGAIVSNVHLQEALRDQAFFTYQKTVLAAFQDVENALIAFTKEQQHLKVLNEAVDDNRKAVDLSLQLYIEGLGDFLNVLVTQLSLYSSENAAVQSEQNIVTDLIALYKALGGGWESEPSLCTGDNLPAGKDYCGDKPQ
ncbi:MAG TPA: RND transporter [Nitrospiraceae bacterium]|jgi:NodT family efflux transporter outer membrane factor (OMF) lipoprotein|nr:RND transporter [Nitrospiraceae bacterium]